LDRLLLACDFVPGVSFAPDFECPLLVVVISAHHHFPHVFYKSDVGAVGQTLPLEEVGSCLSVDHPRDAVSSPGLGLGIGFGKALADVAFEAIDRRNRFIVQELVHLRQLFTLFVVS
jgi:hypothetical protein